MARIGIEYQTSDLLAISPLTNPEFVGLTFGRNPSPDGEIGFRYPFNLRIYQIFYSDPDFRDVEVDLAGITTNYHFYGGGTYSLAERAIDAATDFLEFIEDQDPLVPEFDFAFFDKVELLNLFTFSPDTVLVSAARIQPGSSIRTHTLAPVGLDETSIFYTLKMEAAMAAVPGDNVPLFSPGLPCPPYWS